MRESWTDDRLDALNGKVDALRLEMKSEFTALREKQADERSAASKHRLDRVQALLNWLTGVIFGLAIALVMISIGVS